MHVARELLPEARSVFPAGFLEALRVERMPADEVTLKPSLVNANVILKA